MDEFFKHFLLAVCLSLPSLQDQALLRTMNTLPRISLLSGSSHSLQNALNSYNSYKQTTNDVILSTCQDQVGTIPQPKKSNLKFHKLIHPLVFQKNYKLKINTEQLISFTSEAFTE